MSTNQQPHTPDTEADIREDFSNRQAGAINRAIARENFDRMIAAAEQRGAERERKDIAASLIDWDVMYGHEPADEETRIQHDIANWIHSRADRIANKEGDVGRN